MTRTIWHNPRCSKSRQTLAILQDSGAEVTIRKYLDDAPTRAELEAAHAALGGRVLDMMRPSEKIFKELGLSKDSDENALLEAMAEHPILIERPLVFSATTAILGRPPENVRALL